MIYDITIMNENIMSLIIYTDGACSRNGYPDAVAGYGVHFVGKEEWNISRRLKGKQTNNRAEMQAVVAALKRVYWKGVKKNVVIITDSQIVKGGFDKRKNSNAANFDLWKKIYYMYDMLSENIKISVEKCDGHAGIEGNEIADKLAVAGKTR